MKSRIFSIALVLVALFSFSTAQAQNAHFEGVTFSEDGLTVTGKIAGLGNAYFGKEITIIYHADVTAEFECTTRGNGNAPIGVNKNTNNLSDSKVIFYINKNGNTTFELKLNAESIESIGCPPGLNETTLPETVRVGAEAANKTLTFQIQGGPTQTIIY